LACPRQCSIWKPTFNSVYFSLDSFIMESGYEKNEVYYFL
jgi:hypothetical protein